MFFLLLLKKIQVAIKVNAFAAIWCLNAHYSL